jgi:hypothetical protein
MKLEQDIYAFLVYKAGDAKRVKGISQTQLTNLKQGKSGISTKKLAAVLKENDLSGILILKSIDASNTVTLKLF